MSDKTQSNTRPAEGTPEELFWLRGYEAAVIQTRKNVDAAILAERDRCAEVARNWMLDEAHHMDNGNDASQGIADAIVKKP